MNYSNNFTTNKLSINTKRHDSFIRIIGIKLFIIKQKILMM